jgi:broad specificity phosphatase PhoE
MKLPIKYDVRLRERHFGSIEGKKFLDLDPTGALRDKDFIHQQYDYRPFGGEAVDDVKKRIFNFIEDVRKETNKKDKILVVTSAGIIRLLHLVLKGEIPEKIHNASVHEFEFPDAI